VREQERDTAGDEQEQFEVVLHFFYEDRQEKNHQKNKYQNVRYHHYSLGRVVVAPLTGTLARPVE
jgi:hypothetical protein